MTKPFNIHDWQAKQRLVEQDDYQKRQDALTPGKNPGAFFGDDSLMNRKRADWKSPPMGMSPGEIDNDLDLLTALRNQIEQGTLDSKMRDKFVELLDDLIDKEDENNDMNLAQDDVRDFSPRQEVEVTGMEPDSGNMEKEINVIGSTNQNEPLTDVTIEYKGQQYILDFEFGDVIDDHGSSGRDEWWEATAEDGTYFMVDIYMVHPEGTPEPDWNTLEVEQKESTETDNIEPMGEQNSLGAAGSGASFKAGNSMAYMPNNAFKKKKK
jgi:hypothetical protein